MAKFLSSPKLEIILSVPSGDTETKKPLSLHRKTVLVLKSTPRNLLLLILPLRGVLPSNNSDSKLDENIGDSALPDRLLPQKILSFRVASAGWL